jgi:hypothetical protein
LMPSSEWRSTPVKFVVGVNQAEQIGKGTAESDESRYSNVSSRNSEATASGWRSCEAGTERRSSSSAGASVRSMPHRSAHRRRRLAAYSPRDNPRTSDCRRRRSRSYKRTSCGHPRGRFLDGRNGRHVPVLLPRSGESLRLTNIYRLYGGRRLC